MIFTMGWELSELGCRKRGSNIPQRRKEPQDDGGGNRWAPELEMN